MTQFNVHPFSGFRKLLLIFAILGLIVLLFLCAWFHGQEIENDINARLSKELSAAGLDATIVVDGQDVILSGDLLPEKKQLAIDMATNLIGVRKVTDETAEVVVALPATEPVVESVVEVQSEPVITPESVANSVDVAPLTEEEKIVERTLTAMSLPSVAFGLNSTQLTEKAKQTLQQVAAVLKQYPAIQIEVAGYTDNSGFYKDNLLLSQQRATAVTEYLQSQGIDSTRLQPKGYGERRPIADNATDAGRAQNRRIEFTIKREML